MSTGSLPTAPGAPAGHKTIGVSAIGGRVVALADSSEVNRRAIRKSKHRKRRNWFTLVTWLAPKCWPLSLSIHIIFTIASGFLCRGEFKGKPSDDGLGKFLVERRNKSD